MSDFANRRFDSRIIDREDSGSAFERFVGEFLAREMPEKTLVRGLARGVDGAIDLADTGQQLEQIVECKFIGADTQSTAVERWNTVKQVLAKNLPPLARGEEKRRRMYRPWLRSQGKLKTYTFATSAVCASADERIQLRNSIKSFFQELSRDHDELSHLGEITVDLRYWDDFVGKSAQFVPLFYRWFGGFPAGYGEIALSFGSEGSFKRFLASPNLPYFSRELYLAKTGEDSDSRVDSIVQSLTDESGAGARVIFGPGGVGKTRLSIEVCEQAREAGWWPIRLDRKARVSELDAICRDHADAADLLLFIDYAEAFEELDQLPQAVARLSADGEHRVAILASTRSSSLQKVTDRLNDLHPYTTDLAQDATQDGYTDWVVRKIVDHCELPRPDDIARTCKGLPAMAAFAGFLFTKDREQFDLQFGNLAAVKDFADWASVRLKILEDRFASHPIQDLLADLVVRLPMPLDEVQSFRADPGVQRDIFDILKADRWIEADGEAYSAAHDVLADAILARHLSAMPRGEQERVQDLTKAALQEGRLDRCMAALDRLGEHPVFQKISGKALVEALMAFDSEKTLDVLPILIRARVLPPEEMIKLLASSEVIRERLADAPEAHLVLARAGEWSVTKGIDTIDRETAELALNAPLGSAVSYSHASNMVLRCAHAFDPARFHDEVVKRLDAAPIALDSHFLIVSLLKWGAPPEDVRPFLDRWLARNSTAIKASFVYQEWLDAKGEIGPVDNGLVGWLSEHGTIREASFVYNSWLRAGGEVSAVSDPFFCWLEEHGTILEASFLYQAWLYVGGAIDAVSRQMHRWLATHHTKIEARFVYNAWLINGGDTGILSNQLLGWLEEHGTISDARFVYQAWLDAGGAVSTISAQLRGWLAENGTESEARFIYPAWLDAGGALDVVGDQLLCWLGEHGATFEASFVYQAWLDAGGEIRVVSDQLLGWIEANGALLEAQFVYNAWLSAGGEIVAVREKLLSWIEEHYTTHEASFVYRAWLKSGQPFEAIRRECEAWLQENWSSEDAVYLTKELSSAWYLSRESVYCILAWAGKYPANEDAIFRLSRISKFFNTYADTSAFSLLVAKVTTAVLSDVFANNRQANSVRDAVSILFGNFAKLQYPRDENWPHIVEMYCEGLRHGSIFKLFGRLPPSTWETMLHEAFALDKLDPVADIDAIKCGYDLVREARSPIECEELFSNGYLPHPTTFQDR